MLVFVPTARADWLLTVNRMGFFGAWGAGAIYEWSERHAGEVSLGGYWNGGTEYIQSNLAYRYTRWRIEDSGRAWNPLELGIFAIRSWDQKSYFLQSPEKYPYENYYDQTRLRFGVEFGSVAAFKEWHLEVAYHVRVLDNGLVATYNNSRKDLQYYVSSGVAIRYRF